MADAKNCSKCGAPLPADASGDRLCPNCLFGLALGQETQVTRDDDSTDAPERIGPYRILEKIGEGGFGEVYAAEQTEPLKRRVALKILKAGMDTKAVLARFEAERQTLAMMDHPNIAKIFDAGETDRGRPYFVMELIHGTPITEHCDRERLTTRERLDLFVQTCQAIQHAHTKGVIHRDVKPTNVLVATVNGRPVPKVIDFGIAKAMTPSLTGKTLYTLQGQVVGTPAYMSPEQAEMTEAGVDTRTDVYSLGVLLYELLTGTLPFEVKSLLEAGLEAMRRIIREEEPPTPSTRISSLGNEASTAAAQRRTEPRRLKNMIRGELDWITMRALEKNPARRYQSANALAEDVERHLNGEAILAAAPSTAYQLRKLAARHKVPMGIGATAVALLVGFGITMGILRQSAEDARAQAQARTEELELVTEFQASMLAGIDVPEMGRAMVADLEGEVRESLEAEGATPAEVEASLEALDRTLGRANATDVALKLVDVHMLQRATKAIEEEFSEQPVVRAALQQSLSETYHALGRLPQAMTLGEAALETQRRVLGDDHEVTLISIGNMGYLCQTMGQLDKALAFYREATEGCRRTLGDDHETTLIAIENVGMALHSMGQLDEALPYYREALDGMRSLHGDDHTYTLSFICNLGALYGYMGNLEEGLTYNKQALEGFRRMLGDDDPNTLMMMNNIGSSLLLVGDFDEGLRHQREALEGYRRAFGDDHPTTLTIMGNVGSALEKNGKPEEVIALLVPAEERVRKASTGGNINRLRVFLLALGRSRTATGSYDLAESNLTEALAILRESESTKVRERIDALKSLAELHEAWHAAEPGAGHDAKAAEWRATLVAYRAESETEATED